MERILNQALAIVFFLSVQVNLQAQDKAPASKVKSIIVQEEDFAKSAGGKRLESETSYDQAGNVVEEKQYRDGKLDSWEENEYDKDGNKIKVITLEESGKVLKYTTYKYEKGLKTEKVIYGANQKMKSKKTYLYKFY